MLASLVSCEPGGKRIGLQLWSLREAMYNDVEGTLKLISEMGYKELETANYDNGTVYGMSVADFKALVEKYGMKVTSTHTGQGWDAAREAEIMAWWDKAIADHKALGCKWIVVPSIFPPDTEQGAKDLCEYFNRVAAKVKAAGMGFGYHNHNFEFTSKIGDISLYDYMLANTSKDVMFEMDVYWVKEGGQDPVDYLTRHAGRFPVLHIKDDSIIGDSGKIDFKSIFEAAYKQGMKNFYVEVEKYPLPAEICVEKSFDFLNGADFVK